MQAEIACPTSASGCRNPSSNVQAAKGVASNSRLIAEGIGSEGKGESVGREGGTVGARVSRGGEVGCV